MSYEQGPDRERTLLLTGSALARETTVDGIGALVRNAVRDLTGDRPDHEALFAVRNDVELTVVATFGERAPPGELAGLAPRLLARMRLLEPTEPTLVQASALDPQEREAAIRGGYESILLCPLVLAQLPSADRSTGVLAVFGKHRELLGMSSAMGILASQAAVALERLVLREKVVRQRVLEDQLNYQAFHDMLTGLANRALFTDRAKHGLSVARRNGTTVAVLFVDLDDFKVVNDTMGHAVGDELLAGVAKRLAEMTRESDTAARLGGDEFALMIETLADPTTVEAFADRVVAAFREPFELSVGSVLAGATVGIATTGDSSDIDELLRHADLSLYAAKSEGKRRWHRYTPELSARIYKRREIQEQLEEALAAGAFTLAYQPIVHLATGKIRGFQARLRWPHPVRGAVPPPEVIELAEESGLIVPIGSWMLRQAITDLASWRGADQDPRQPAVSVRVSARQFLDPGFVVGLRRYLEETGLRPAAIVLELTISSLRRQDERITADLEKLKDLGIRLVIEDFGTGYSSLSYVRELPLDLLRIDESFVAAVTEPTGRKFVEIIIAFAHAIGVDTLAEGIETEDQRAALIEIGCLYGQGSLIAMPMEWHAAQQLLRSVRSRESKCPR